MSYSDIPPLKSCHPHFHEPAPQPICPAKTGGKQYKVQAGDTLRVELLAAEAGDKVQFNEILMVGGDAPQLGSAISICVTFEPKRAKLCANSLPIGPPPSTTSFLGASSSSANLLHNVSLVT